MINSEIQDGFHYEKEKPEEHTEAQLKLMKTQDANYVNYKLSTELKKIEKLKSALAVLDVEDKPKNVHTFYVDSKAEAKTFDVAKRLNTLPALLDRAYNRLTVDALRKMKLYENLDDESLRKASKHMNQQYNELSKRIERAKELLVLRQKLDVKKKLLNKNDPLAKLVKEGSKTSAPVYIWKKERKR
ncbi:probable U3 small nucleolar RNA-associated protein 11 [Stegodyphus dumicola]|uniref:probable U3 small nucleolar RNA-associated protein 11 n=1 Tax=Stegodyphus dumicola TaxID=202533 RepID=UPI0015AA3BBB|nr:probable U3 small nucleolar RNA-associated protein 11 [Stegodyphus dumicola]